jgi:hypothetical protein
VDDHCGPLRRARCDVAVDACRTARGDIVGQTARALRRPSTAADQFLHELLDVVERSECLEVVRAREDERVGGVTDPTLLEIVELGRAEVGDCLSGLSRK